MLQALMQADMDTVFFGADSDFASAWQCTRNGVATVTVQGILGIADEDALESRAITAVRVLRLPASADVRASDILTAMTALPTQGVLLGDRFVVLDAPQRVGDGAEIDVHLGRAPT